MSPAVSMKALLESGVHFGHRTNKWNPMMRPYIFTERNGIHILDLQQTVKLLDEAFNVVRACVADGGTILFVGTKRQAQETIQREADRCGMPYVNERWLGGTFTNFKIIKKRIDHYKDLEKKTLAGEFEKYTKKEQAMIQKEIKVLEKKLGGIRAMEKIPEAIFVADMEDDRLAVKEAKQNGVKVIGISDVNIDPNIADYPIIANDDSMSSVRFVLERMKEAILEGKGMFVASVSAGASEKNKN